MRSRRTNRRQVAIALVGAVIALAVGAGSALARMTIVYDTTISLTTLIGVQGDGSPGLSVADGLFEQVSGPLPVDRKVGGLTGGIGSTSTPSIRDLSGTAIMALIREEVDLAGARLVFIDLGPEYDSAGTDGANLDAAMVEAAATPFAGGGTYADRVHFYVSRIGQIATPDERPQFWHALALSAGVWLEAYQQQVQWAPEFWLAWPRALRNGLVAHGMNPTRIHIIVRGANQAATWANFRTGAACELLANGPGAYRITDHLGFVREFRATFGTSPAPVGPSPVACTPTPVLPSARATQLADVLALEGSGVAVPSTALSSRRVRTGRTTTLTVSLGADSLGLAGRLGVDPVTFWRAAQARVTVNGPGISTSTLLLDGGTASVPLTPTGHGPISLGLQLDGAAIRQAIGSPVDLAVTLAPHRARVQPVLDRMVSQPLGWQMTIPLITSLRSAPAPPRLTARILRRNLPPKLSRVELRLSRPATKLLVEVGVRRRGSYVRLRRFRITGTRQVVLVRIPKGVPISARIAEESVT